MAKYNIIIDTETTGLPKSRGYGHTPNYTELNNYKDCRLVQIAWIICDNEGDIKSQKSFLIKPNGFVVPESATKIHKITNKNAVDNGIPFELMVAELSESIKYWKPTKIIAHNLKFDINVLLSELHRNNYQTMIEVINLMKGICTMETGKPLCNIICNNRRGEYVKFPSLPELYKYLFEVDMEVKHEALYDTQKCLECYIELRKRIKKNQ